MARRRRGGPVKSARQTRKGKKNEKINGILDDPNLMDADSRNGVSEGNSTGSGGNCNSGNGEPVVHHKKFGKIRMSGQNENSQDVETSTSEASKDYSRFDSKSSDENESEPLENNRFARDDGIMNIMRGIEISESKNRTSYTDFRKQSSVYNVENDIPLDGSVIIKPGTFSSNTISSSLKPNLFFDSTSSSEISSVNFLKVLQGIEMLERNVSGSMEFDRTALKENKNFIMNPTLPGAPMYLNEETDSGQCKHVYSGEVSQFSNIKTYDEPTSEVTIKNEPETQTEEVIKSNISSPDDTFSDLQNETEETVTKLQNIALDENRDTSGSPSSKTSDDAATDRQVSSCKTKMENNDVASSESSLNGGAPIRRSNRIRTIGIMKQKEKELSAGKPDNSIKSPLPPGSPAVTPPIPGYDDKPVKVKSRWRRSSELEMHNVKGADSELTVSSNCSSPVNPAPQIMSLSTEPTPEELEKLEKEKREIEEGLKSFTVLTENEYKMERNACKETKRMVCDCMLTKEEIIRGEAGCGEDCLNRMLFLECGPRCALGERCTNKRFQKLQYANCKIFKTEKKGFGLRAETDLAANTFIMEYVGEVVDQKEFTRRVKMYAKDNNKHFYFMALKGDAVIDATNKGNISRFINHSCDPNAETQKWTINGELRVGFFTRRFIRAGEEITFDYQFQRYGKQAQKCYCEALCCRGWIGENPDDSVEDDEEDEDEDEDDDDEDEEEEDEREEEDEEQEEGKEVEGDEKKEIKKFSKTDDEKEKKEEIAKPSQPGVEKVKKPKKRNLEKKKERKTTTIVDDMGLDEEIQKLFQTGLKNRAHTLTLSRLMVRAEDWSTRGKLLKLIREGETPCRRLFLDYHGLRLICSWMLSRELEESPDKNERRLEILRTLSKLPIPNKNMLIDSKVLNVVEQWSKSGNIVRKLSVDEETVTDENKKSKGEETIPGLGGEIEEKPVFEPGKVNNIQCEETEESSEKVKRMAEAVLESWSSLKEVFKIPKKERIEQMKEHERQADRGYSEYLDNKENFRDKYDRHDRHDRYGRMDRYRGDRDRLRDRKRLRESPPDPEWFRNHERHSKMTKHERRQLFALKVLQEDEEAKKRSEQLEMWKQHESRCLALGLDPNLNAACDPQTGFPIFFDHNTGTWQNCPPSSGPSPSMSHTSSICPSPMYPVGPPMMQNCQNCPMCTNISPMCSNMNNPICQNVPCHNGMMQHNPLPVPNGPVPMPPCQSSTYSNMTPQYQTPSILPVEFEAVAPPYQEPVVPENVQPAFNENEVNEIPRPFITEVPLNIPIRLPPKWKSAKDSKGRVYYYHVKERVSQWEPPQWTEEDAKIEAARTVALEMGDDSSSSTESSTDTSSEEEDEDPENVLAGNLKQTENSQKISNSEEKSESKEDEEVSDSKNKSVEDKLERKMPNEAAQWLDDEKDEDLSAWEDEEDSVKTSKTLEEKASASASNGEKSGTSVTSIPTAPPVRVRRAGLVQEIIISPRREEDRIDNRKFKEVKEMLRRQKEEVRAKLRIKGEKGNVRLSRSKKKKKEKISRSNRPKSEKLPSAISESSTDKKIKENFKNSMAGAIVSHLNPYRKQDCKVGRITCNEDFKHLARKLTHFVMLKELKHCKGVDDLECNDSVKAKAKDFIKKYMAKFGAVYQRPQHEIGKT